MKLFSNTRFNLTLLSICFFASPHLGICAEKPKEQPRYKAVEQDERISNSNTLSPQQQNLFGGIGLDYFNSFGLQGRYSYRALDEGFFEALDDAFFLEGGLGLTLYGAVKGARGVTGFSFVLSGRWDFILDPEWTVFGLAGFGFNAVSAGLKAEDVKGGGFFPALGLGAMYNIAPEWAVRADLSYQFIGAGVLYRF